VFFPGRDGVNLAYREVGEGRPLVLLHGLVGDATQWLRHGQAEAIAASGYRVIMPDFRGHGASAKPHDASAYPPDVLADDGLALLDHLGLDDYDLGGYSLGARIVVRMLVRGATPRRAVVAETQEEFGQRMVHQVLSHARPIDMHVGTIIEYRLKLHGLPLRWLTQIEAWEPGVRFVDRQLRGPYALWHHTHEFEPLPGGDTLMHDVVRYALPFGPAGALAHRLLVRRDLARIFDFRSKEVARRIG